MKHSLLVISLILIITSQSNAQESIYFANGDKLPNARLIDATDEKVVMSVKRDGTTGQYKFQRSNVLMAFNTVGDFLVISSLPADGPSARQRIEQFATATTPVYKTDFLVKAVPLTVIPAIISYESDQVVNYKTLQGTAASINKDDLVMILRRDGRHQLIMSPTEMVSLLPTIRQQIEQGGSQPPVATPPVSSPPVSSPRESTPPGPSLGNTGSPAVNPPSLPESTTVTASAVPPTTPAPSTINVNVNVNSPSPIPPSQPAARPVPALSEADYLIYREKALRHVDEFANYLNIIADKSIPSERRDQAIEQAARLFLPSATIEVTSATRPGARRYPIREYLTRLKLLPYSRVNIEWSEIQYIRELVQAADGNYYGTISGQQTFTGYGGVGSRNVLYSDVTRKNVRVRLRPYEKGDQLKWDVLLGNIGVANH